MSFFSTIKNKILGRSDKDTYLSGFRKTSKAVSSKLNDLKSSYTGVNEEFLEELMVILLESDVGMDTANEICTQLEKKANEYFDVKFNNAMNFLLEIMYDIYDQDEDPQLIENPNGPTVIFLVGVNGSGKTTTAAKLIKKFQDEGKSVCVAAADTFRAGAIDQLASWADKMGVPCIKGKENGDPASVCVDGCRYAVEHHMDILICDTAGRLQNKVNLMKELSKMHKVVNREIENAPHNVWLVLDSTTGQNGLNQAKVFLEATHVTGIILTKMDGTAKGGIVLAIKHTLHIPVYYIGLGERESDLRPFDVSSYLYSIFEGVSGVEKD